MIRYELEKQGSEEVDPQMANQLDGNMPLNENDNCTLEDYDK